MANPNAVAARRAGARAAREGKSPDECVLPDASMFPDEHEAWMDGYNSAKHALERDKLHDAKDKVMNVREVEEALWDVICFGAKNGSHLTFTEYDRTDNNTIRLRATHHPFTHDAKLGKVFKVTFTVEEVTDTR